MPSQEEMENLRQEALHQIKKLEEERDLWQARAFDGDDIAVIGACVCLTLGFLIMVAGVWLKSGAEMGMIVSGAGLLYAGSKFVDALD